MVFVLLGPLGEFTYFMNIKQNNKETVLSLLKMRQPHTIIYPQSREFRLLLVILEKLNHFYWVYTYTLYETLIGTCILRLQ